MTNATMANQANTPTPAHTPTPNTMTTFSRTALFATVREDRVAFTATDDHRVTHKVERDVPARPGIPGVAKVRWTNDRTYTSGTGRTQMTAIVNAPETLGSSGARLIAGNLKADFYLTAAAPAGVRQALQPWIDACDSKAKADLMTLVKRQGLPIALDLRAEYAERAYFDKTKTGRRIGKRRIDDLGQLVLTGADFARLAENLGLGSKLEAFQGTVLWSNGVYFKGSIVPHELCNLDPGFYGGLKAPSGVEADVRGAQVVYASLMDAYAAGPWGCTVNTQQLAYCGLGGFALPSHRALRKRTAERIALADAGIPGAREAANREVIRATHEGCHKTHVRGFAGKLIAVRDETDAPFVVMLSKGKAKRLGLSDGDVVEAAFGWSPFLATNTALPRVDAVVRVVAGLNGPHLIGVNLAAPDSFVLKLFMQHAGRDTDGDGVQLVLERRIVKAARPWREVPLTNSTKHKAQADDAPCATPEAAVRESLRRQLAAAEIGKADLMARRIRLHAKGYVDQVTRNEKATRLDVSAAGLAPHFEAWIQLAISSMKKLIDESALAAHKREIYGRFSEEAFEAYKEGAKKDLANGVIPAWIPDLQKAGVEAAKKLQVALKDRETAAVAYRRSQDSASKAGALERGKEAAEDVRKYSAVLDRILTALADEAQARRRDGETVTDGLATVRQQRQLLSLVSLKDRSGQTVGKLTARGEELRHLAHPEAREQAFAHLARIHEVWESVRDAYSVRDDEEDTAAVVYAAAVEEIAGIVDTMLESCGPVAAYGVLLGKDGLTRSLLGEVLTLERVVCVDSLPTEKVGLRILEAYPVPVQRKGTDVAAGARLTRGELGARAVFGASVSVLPKAGAYEVVEVREDFGSVVERKRQDAASAVLMVRPVA